MLLQNVEQEESRRSLAPGGAAKAARARSNQVVANVPRPSIGTIAGLGSLGAFQSHLRYFLFRQPGAACELRYLPAVSIAGRKVHPCIHAGRILPQYGFPPRG